MTKSGKTQSHLPVTKPKTPAPWVGKLLTWFSQHRRAMPWRDAPTPYAVWISEMMLQQTQVATVMPYFTRFMERFPDVQALASADEQAVLKLWEGLGYYARARNLRRAAQLIVNELGGRIPETAAELAKLPGLGDYASAAIASIASQEPVPAVDGNVLRVWARFRGMEADVARPATRLLVYRALLPHIQPVPPGDFNQALMELGALVCRPRNPACEVCPLTRTCEARRLGRTAELPVKTKTKAGPHHDVTTALVRKGPEYLVARRPVGGMLGGLWEFPGDRVAPGERPEAALVRIMPQLTGLQVKILAKLKPVPHAFSHFRTTTHGFMCRPAGGRMRPRATCAELKWVRPEDLRALPLTKVTSVLAAHLWGPRLRGPIREDRSAQARPLQDRP